MQDDYDFVIVGGGSHHGRHDRANAHLTTVMIAEKLADHLEHSVKSHGIRNP